MDSAEELGTKIRAVFLDRDGTIIKNSKEPIRDPEKIEYENNALAGLQAMRGLDFELVMVSNQGGVGAGKITEEEVKSVNDSILRYMEQNGARFLGDFYCTHKSDEGCECRKPNIGLFIKAIAKYNIDLSASWTIGDKTADILAGRRVGTTTILVKTGNAGRDGEYIVTPHYAAMDLLGASNAIKYVTQIKQ